MWDRKPKIELVAVDLDGTLLTSERVVAPEGARWLRRAHRQGVRVIVSSTRNPGSACGFGRSLDISDPIVCTNGAQVWGSPTGPVWAYRPFSREIGLAIARLADERDWELSTTVGAMTYWRQRPGQALGAMSSQITVVSTNVQGIVGDPVRILVSQTKAMEGIQALCRARFADRCQLEVYAGADGIPHSLGVYAAGATKGTGLALVMERLGIDPGAVMAIGDNACDLSMYPHARVRVVMDNAPPDVKREAIEAGAVVAPSNDDEGVAWAVRTFVLEGEGSQ
jgi:HAD superfamily hydrolase (TIGR01484 family)